MTIHGDCRDVLRTLPDESVHCCVTSPPYWGLRDYGLGDDAIGLEPTPQLFVEHIVEVFREVRRVLRPDGTLWLNLGDSYANDAKWGGSTGGKHVKPLHGEAIGRGKRNTGLKPKDLVGIPWMVAFALRDDGWYLRSEIIWHKPNPMPESVKDRPTKAHEQIFLLAKRERYFFNQEAVREPQSQGTIERFGENGKRTGGGPKQTGSPNGLIRDKATSEGILPNGRNIRSVWTIATQPYPEAHFATFPEEIAKRCILAGCPKGGTVLDPFAGSGTVGQVAESLQCNAVLIEARGSYIPLMERRLAQGVLPLTGTGGEPATTPGVK